jgi:hypothetical protein
MENQIKLNQEHRLINTEFINKVEQLESSMLAMNTDLVAKGNSDMFPLKHSFSEGVYIREMFMQKTGVVIGKLYKISHTWFLLEGEITVATDEGVNAYIAPCYVYAPEGTKRVIYAVEDSVFVNVYPNPENITDIATLEDMLTCKSYEEYKEYKLLNE